MRKKKTRKKSRETEALSEALYSKEIVPMGYVDLAPMTPPIGIHEMMRKMTQVNR